MVCFSRCSAAAALEAYCREHVQQGGGSASTTNTLKAEYASSSTHVLTTKACKASSKTRVVCSGRAGPVRSAFRTQQAAGRPCQAPTCSAVLPALSLLFTATPFLMSRSISWIWPVPAASISSVRCCSRSKNTGQTQNESRAYAHCHKRTAVHIQNCALGECMNRTEWAIASRQHVCGAHQELYTTGRPC